MKAWAAAVQVAALCCGVSAHAGDLWGSGSGLERADFARRLAFASKLCGTEDAALVAQAEDKVEETQGLRFVVGFNPTQLAAQVAMDREGKKDGYGGACIDELRDTPIGIAPELADKLRKGAEVGAVVSLVAMDERYYSIKLGELETGIRERSLRPELRAGQMTDLRDRRREAREKSLHAAQRFREVVAGHDSRQIYHIKGTPLVEVTLNQEIVSLLDREGLILAAWEDVLLAPALTSSVSLVRAPQAWARRGNEPSDGRGQMVVVIDTGVNGGHDFLKTKDGSKVVYEGCFSKGTRYDPVCPGKLPESSGPGSAAPCDMRVDPICEHGTQVAGIIAGSNGRFGKASFSGVAPGARLIAIQTFQKVTGADECKLSEDKRTDGKRVDPALCFRMPIANLLAALQNVVDLADSFPIAAVNVSVSLPDLWRNHCAERLYFHIARTVQDLRVRGIAVIAATGNDGQPEAIAAPSCVPGVIAVAGSDKADNIDLSYSNRNHLVELVAPGTAILSSALTEIYKPGSGTSFAAAHVSGAWAVLKSIDPAASVDTIRDALSSTGAMLTDEARHLPRIDLGKAAATVRVRP